MKLTSTLAVVCVMVVMVTARPSKRFISIHEIEHGLHHLGHEIEHGVHHVGHEIEHGVHHVGHEIEHGVHHVGHEIEHGVHHVGHEIEHGVHHLGHELGHITGIHSTKDLACKLYSTLKGTGEATCDAQCVALLSSTVYGVPLCPTICHMIFHEASKLVNC